MKSLNGARKFKGKPYGKTRIRAYGIPRDWDFERPDVLDGRIFGIKASTMNLREKGGDYRSTFRSTEVKRQNRRFWKKRERSSAKDECLRYINNYERGIEDEFDVENNPAEYSTCLKKQLWKKATPKFDGVIDWETGNVLKCGSGFHMVDGVKVYGCDHCRQPMKVVRPWELSETS